MDGAAEEEDIVMRSVMPEDVPLFTGRYHGIKPLYTTKKAKTAVDEMNQSLGFSTQFEAFVQLTNDFMCTTFVDGHFIWVNAAICRALELGSEDILGHSAIEFIHPDDVQSTLQKQKDMIESPDMHYFQNRYRKKDGAFICIEWTAIKVGDVFFSTGRQREGIDDYLSTVTHNLRTPLNSILGFGKLLETSTNLDEEDRECVECIIKSGTRLIKTINGIIENSRSDNDGYQTRRINVLASFIAVAKQMTAILREKDVRLVIRPARLENDVLGSSRFVEVIENLLSNALKYNKQGGSITVTGNIVEKDGTTYLSVAVHDTGRGVSPDFFKNFCVPFQREYSDIEGTGLGLSVSKKVVEMMGGSLTLSSAKDKWTTVTMDLPIGGSFKMQDPDNHAKPIVFGLGPPKLTIVYLDDNEMNILLVRRLIKKVLKKNYTFLSPATVAEALKVLRGASNVDLLILDYHLPDGTGLDVAKQLPSIEGLTVANVWMLTADTGKKAMEEAKQVGVETYLLKPLSLELCTKLLEEICRGR
jgi:PAS domain S-box-containing protein